MLPPSKQAYDYSMGIIKDITGRQYGRLTVIGLSYKEGHTVYWDCLCSCGNRIKVRTGSLQSGNTKSCGCLKLERIGNLNKKHGLSKTKLHRVWAGMHERCYRKEHKSYAYYGGRGITVCEEWHNFIKFRDWAIANGYREGLTLDRINVNGVYCPENCRWVSHIEQSRNTRRNRYVTYNGETHCIAEWATLLHIDMHTLLYRLTRYKWPVEKAFTTPVLRTKPKS